MAHFDGGRKTSSNIMCGSFPSLRLCLTYGTSIVQNRRMARGHIQRIGEVTPQGADAKPPLGKHSLQEWVR